MHDSKKINYTFPQFIKTRYFFRIFFGLKNIILYFCNPKFVRLYWLFSIPNVPAGRLV